MAVYPELLLSHGGGIMPAARQTAQVANTVNLFIGVGGTGIDAIRRIKTEAYSRIIPDDMEATEPRYSQIRFLGVDSDEYSIGLRENEHDANCRIKSLSDSEFFSIADPYIAPYNYGAGGIRQVGRFLFVKKSGQFVSRLQDILKKARVGLIKPTINIHIFSGLGGGTGSGCFFGYLLFSPFYFSANRRGENLWIFFPSRCQFARHPYVPHRCSSLYSQKWVCSPARVGLLHAASAQWRKLCPKIPG